VLVLIEGMRVGGDGLVPLSDLTVASPQPAIDVRDLRSQHHRVLSQSDDDLRVVCCCSFKLHL
jgi:hypothetical protein